MSDHTTDTSSGPSDVNVDGSERGDRLAVPERTRSQTGSPTRFDRKIVECLDQPVFTVSEDLTVRPCNEAARRFPAPRSEGPVDVVLPGLGDSIAAFLSSDVESERFDACIESGGVGAAYRIDLVRIAESTESGPSAAVILNRAPVERGTTPRVEGHGRTSKEPDKVTRALLDCSRALLDHANFESSARVIYDACKRVIGATAGYVALLSDDGSENEVLFLDAGPLPCTVDPSLPMPIRGLRETAYRSGKPVFDNDFSNSRWMKFMPEGHAELENVLFAPLIVDGDVVGLLGLANKPGGFHVHDAEIAASFAEFAAVGLINNRTLESLEQSEERFRTVFHAGPDAVLIVRTEDGVCVDVNEGFTTITGYEAGDVVGRPIDDNKLWLDSIDKPLPFSLLAGRETTASTEVKVRRKDGRIRRGLLGLRAVKLNGIDHALLKITDLEPQKLAEAALSESESRYRELFNAAGDAIFVHEDERSFLDVNDVACTRLGYTREELKALGPGGIDAPEFAARVPALMREIHEQGAALFETAHIAKGGVRIPTEISCRSITFRGRPAFLSVARDISDRKRFEEEILRQSAVLDGINRLFRETLQCDTVEDVARKCLEISESLTRSRFGFIGTVNNSGTFDTLALSDPGWDACRLEEADAPGVIRDMDVRGIWGSVLRSAQSLIVNDPDNNPDRVGLPDGHPRIDTFLSAPLMSAGRAFGMIAVANRADGYTDHQRELLESLSAAFVEVLHHREAREALQESETRFRQLAENIHEVFWLTKAGEPGKLTYVSPAFSEVWGRSPDRYYDAPDRWLDSAHTEDRKSVEESYKRFIQGRGVYEATYRIIRPDGVFRWIWDRAFPIYDEKGGIWRVAGIAQDITLRKLEEDRRNQLMEEIRNFTYIVSHDLNAPLVNLKGFVREIREAVSIVRPAVEAGMGELPEERRKEVVEALEEDLLPGLDFIDSAVSRIDGLVRAVLGLSRLGRMELHLVNLNMNELVREMVDSMAYQINSAGVTVVLDDLPDTVADRTAMEQIVGNLLSNAIKFLSPERPGVIHISGRRMPHETVFSVSDNGRGIRESDLMTIFDMFKRADAGDTQGEGMGLAYVRTLVRRHGGRVWCESEPGKGAVFTFTIARSLMEGERHA